MSSPSDISELLDESLKMKAFSHPNILNLIGVCVDAGPAPYVVMPYMERGSLLHFLKKERPHFTLAEGADSELVSPIPKHPHANKPHSHSKTGSSLRPSSSVFAENYQAFVCDNIQYCLYSFVCSSGVARSLVLAGHLLYTSPLASCSRTRLRDRSGTNMVPWPGTCPARPALRYATE